jgi:predicted ATP-grasp superfamily ATP-dependent carboligase
MRRNILFLSERDFLTLPVIRSIDRRAFGVFIMGPAASPVRFSRFCRKYFPYPKYSDTNKNEVLVEYINAVSIKYAIDVIIPLDLDSTLWVVKNKSNLKKPTLLVSNVDVIERLHNKWELTKILDELSILYPKTVLVKNKKYLVHGIMEYPFLIKPLDRDSGVGIVKMENPTDLQKYFGIFPILAQKYIDGYDIDLSLLAVNGKIINSTIQRWTRHGFFEFISNPEIYAIGEKIVARERYSGFLHIDLRVDGKTVEIFVLECNPRAWGTMNASILSGVDFISDAVACALGEPVVVRNVSMGTYMTFIESLKMIIKRPWKYWSMSKVSKRDFLIVLSDALVYILLGWRIWRKK